MRVIALLLISSVISCKSNTLRDAQLAETSAVEGKVYCAVPKEQDFVKVADASGRDAALSKVIAGEKFAKVKETLGIPDGKEKDWLLKAITPLGMGCSSFFKRDITAYGQDSFVNFANLVLSMYLPADAGGINPQTLSRGPFSMDETRDPKKYPIIATLRAINSQVAIASKGPNNRELKPGEIIYTNPKGELRDGDRIDSNVLTAEQVKQLEENIAGEKILQKFLIEEKKDKKDQKDKPAMAKSEDGTETPLPPGTYLAYPPASQVKSLLKKMNDQFMTESKGANEEKIIDAAATLMRRCVSIHPFGDGNGRTCTLIGAWVLAQRKIPHSVIWAGDDVLLKNSVWINRYREGAAFHKALLPNR
jgi:hypothetical protein